MKTDNIIYIGYWRRREDGTKEFFGDDNTLPFPEADKLTDEEVLCVLARLDDLEKCIHVKDIVYRGSSKCRICKCINGSREFVLERGGKMYHWPEGLRHYVEEHRVALPTLLWQI